MNLIIDRSSQMISSKKAVIFNIRHSCAYISIVLLVLLMTACGSDRPLVEGAVPLGDKAALEKLAESYVNLSQQLLNSPTSLSPKERKEFVQQVFSEAGYDYLITLRSLADGGLDKRVQYHHDLVELLFMPHLIKRLDKLSEIYSPAEIEAIEKITLQLE